MNAALVDTDVVSMLFKGDTRALAYRPHLAAQAQQNEPLHPFENEPGLVLNQ